MRPLLSAKIVGRPFRTVIPPAAPCRSARLRAGIVFEVGVVAGSTVVQAIVGSAITSARFINLRVACVSRVI